MGLHVWLTVRPKPSQDGPWRGRPTRQPVATGANVGHVWRGVGQPLALSPSLSNSVGLQGRIAPLGRETTMLKKANSLSFLAAILFIGSLVAWFIEPTRRVDWIPMAMLSMAVASIDKRIKDIQKQLDKLGAPAPRIWESRSDGLLRQSLAGFRQY
jgi:hypothetical protein